MRDIHAGERGRGQSGDGVRPHRRNIGRVEHIDVGRVQAGGVAAKQRKLCAGQLTDLGRTQPADGGARECADTTAQSGDFGGVELLQRAATQGGQCRTWQKVDEGAQDVDIGRIQASRISPQACHLSGGELRDRNGR